MKKLTFLLALAVALLALPSIAEESTTEEPVLTTLLSDGSPNTWTQADLVAALQLLNRKYHREVEKPAGREAWHGKLVRQEIDTEREVKIETYEDGKVFEIPFHKPKTQIDPTGSINPRQWDNVPPALAAARRRRQEEKATTNIVTVVVGDSNQ